jgi:ELWxxDGT repeat protein/VCBS repeat-containing protein
MSDIAGNSLGTATLLNLSASVQSFPDTVTPAANDYYRFTLNNRSSFNLSLTSLTANVNVTLLDSAGNPLSLNGVPQNSSNSGTFVESINTILDIGTYYIRVFPETPVPTANYILNVSTSTNLTTDILWRNSVTTQNFVWVMNGASLASFYALEPAPGAWTIQASADFNRDDNADIVWRNTQTGENIVWLMNGTSVASFTFLPQVSDAAWRIQAAADFSGDNQPDIVWRNYRTGENLIWLMNGVSYNTFATIPQVEDLAWEIGGVGNFNQDNQPDIVWRNYRTGENLVWLMNGTSYSTFRFLEAVPDANWRISGTGNFNGDTQTDILWRNYVSGENIVWFMNGLNLTSFTRLTPVEDRNWVSLAPLTRTNQPLPIDLAGNTLPEALNLGNNLSGNATYRDGVSQIDRNDYYRFSLGSASSVSVGLTNLTDNLDLELLDSNGVVLQSATLLNAASESILQTLNAGTYYLRVYPANNAVSSTYALGLSVNNLPVLAQNTSLTVNEGTAADINSSRLRATDNDTPAGQLLYTVTDLPDRGNLLLNGTTLAIGSTFTQADLDAANRLRYQHDGSETLSDSFSFTLFDGSTSLAGNTFSITVNPVNDAPVLVTNQALSLQEGGTVTIASSALSSTDPDSPPANLVYSLTTAPQNGTLFLGTTAVTSFTQADINSGQLRYQHNGSETLTDSFTFTVTDGVITTPIGPNSFNLTITPINDPPGISRNAGLTLNEGATATIGNTALLLTDADGPGSITYTLSTVPTTGVLRLGSQTLATGQTFTQVDIAANQLSYIQNGSETLTDSFSFTASDGSAVLDTTSFAITVNPVNDPPVLTVPGSQTIDQNANTLISGIQVTDVDLGSGDFSVTLSASNGLLTLGTTAGLTFLDGTGTGNRTMTFTGRADVVNAALAALLYRSDAAFQGTDTIAVTVSDRGNTGTGGAQSDSDSIAVTVLPINQPPIITLPSSQTVNEDTNLTISGISIADLDAGNGTMQVSLSATNGVLSLGSTSGITLITGTGSQDRNVTFSGTLSQINAALNNLVYRGGQEFSGTDLITVSVNDGGNTGSGVPLSDTKTLVLTVNSVNDQPLLTVPSAQTVNENTNLRITGIAVRDVDAGLDGNLTVSLSAASGTLSLNSTAGLAFSSGNGTQNSSMIFRGNLAAINNALSALTYRGNANFNGSDSILLSVNDNGNTGFGIALSDTQTIAVNVLGSNNPPVISLPAVPEANTGVNLVISGISVSDPDAGGEDMRLTIAAANGVLSIPIAGLTFLQGTGNQNTRITVLGSIGAVNNALANLVYRSNPGFTGFDTLTISVSDEGNTGIGVPLSDTQRLFVNVGGAVNNAPVASDDEYSLNRNGVLNVTGSGVLSNDTDVDGNPLNANLVTAPNNGSLILNNTGAFLYTPNTNFAGVDSFVYRATDGINPSNLATVTLTVSIANTPPIANNDTYNVLRGGSFTATSGNGVLANDADAEGATLTASLVSGTGNGLLTLNPDGSFTYTPSANFVGTDVFTYRTSDGTVNSTSVATVTLNVTNAAPAVANDSYSTLQNQPLSITAPGVLSNDTDAEGNPFTATIVAQPTRGTVTLNPDGSFTYTPNLNFAGTDSFTYRASDGIANSAPATVTIQVTAVNTPPVSNNDTYSVRANGSLAITAPGVLNNDTDADGNPLTATVGIQPGSGTVTLNADGSFTYVPTLNFVGTDSFTYRANDGVANSTATVTINVTNTAPAAANDSYSVTRNGTLSLTAPGVLSNDTDAEGNPLTATVVTQPGNGTVTLNADGSFTYIPTTGFTGTDSFTYRASDAIATSTATVTVTVTPPSNTAPTVVNDSFSIRANGTLTVTAPGVLSNDTDAEGNPLTATVATQPGSGSVTLNPDGSFTYVPAIGFTGTDSFTYRANDGSLDATGTVTVNITNAAPVASNDTFSIGANATLRITAPGVLSNDTDANGDPLTAIPFIQPRNGSLSLNADGSFTYVPVLNFVGVDSFTYLASDGGDSSGATVTITVTPPVNTAPTVVNDSFSVRANGTLAITAPGVLSNDTDAEGNPLTATVATQPGSGTVTLNPNGSFTYVPTLNFVGTDSFTYRANDGSLDTTGTVILSVTNAAPAVVNDTFSVRANGTLSLTAPGVLSNDTDADGNPLTATVVTQPGSGSVTLNADGSFTYVPTLDFVGADSFTYRANDGIADSTATVTVNVTNSAPVVANDTYTTTRDTSLTIAAPGVLSNDTDTEGSALTATVVTQPGNGTVTLNADGSFTYTPTAGFTGTDSFTYLASDAIANSTATVTITVNPPGNTAPTVVNDTFSVRANGTLAITAPGVLSNDTDAEGNPLTATVVTQPGSGTVTLNPDGSFTYVPTLNFVGTDSFTYRANDGSLDATGTVTVSVTNTAPAVVNDSFSVRANNTLTITAPGVLSNDTDAEGNPLTATVVTQPGSGTVTLNPDGSFTYVPTLNFVGTDSFTYRANDGIADSTATVTVSVTNAAPAVVNDSFSVRANGTLAITAPGVLSNDTDADGNPLTATVVTQPGNGTVTLNPDGSFTYVPTIGFTGTDSFTYQASDGIVAATATAIVTVNPPDNAAPVANPDTYTIRANGTLSITAPGVLSNDTDAEGSPLTATVVTQGSNGTVTLNADGSFTYAPTLNFVGTDSFTYRANDGTADSTGSVTITVTNSAPAVSNDSYTLRANGSLVITAPGVLGNDTDTEGNPLTATVVNQGSNGTVTLNADGSFTYVPTLNFVGTDSFTYRANDGIADSTGTVTLTVTNSAPAVSNDTYSTTRDVSLTIAAPGVLSNDTDAEGSPLTATIVTQPGNGTVTLNPDGSFTYVPTTGFTGTDSFTYQANDGIVGTTATAIVTVNPPGNTVPVANPDTFNIRANGTLSIAAPGVLSNDTDAEGNPLTATVVTQPGNGTVTLNPDGSFTYVPTLNFVGTDSFTYRADDGTDNATGTVILSITNSAPAVSNDSYTIRANGTLAITAPGVLSNDSDTEGNPLTATVATQGSNGSITLNPDGSFTYVPTLNFVGTDSFTYRASDGITDSTATVTLTITNTAPAVSNDNYTTTRNTALTITAPGVLSNDTDAEGNPLTAAVATQPDNGTVTLNADGSFTYTPTTGFTGSDSFTYLANDGIADSTATVTITVNPPPNTAPTAGNDTYSIGANGTLSITAPGVLSNDIDAEGDPLTATVITQPGSGSVTLNPDGSFTYVPTLNFTGADSFTYRANDGSLSDTGTVTVNVTNAAPVVVGETFTLARNGSFTITAPGVLSNDTDPEGSPLTATVVTQGSNGSVTLNPDGSFTYVPTPNFVGTDSFTYRASDGITDSTATVTLTITNTAPAVSNDSYTTTRNTALTITAPGVLSNDTDAEGNPLTATVVTQVINGTVTLNPDGSFTYTPTTGFAGTDSFTYQASDGISSSTATVTFSVTAGANTAPIANNDTYTAPAGGTLSISSPNILANDSDAEGDPLTATVVNNPSSGSLTLNSNGSFTYVPTIGFTGTDSFTYRVNDGLVDSAPATVTITVIANTAPVANDDTYIAAQNQPLTVSEISGVLSNDTDVETGQPQRATIATSASNGSVVLNPNGSFTYTPTAGFVGTDSFTYRANDGVLDSAPATVTISVVANTPPVATSDSYTAIAGSTLTVDNFRGVLRNDSDVEANPLTATVVTQAANGTVSLSPDGSFTYTPSAGFIGTDSFTYQANDGQLNSAPATVTLTVRVNTLPVVQNDTYAVISNTPRTVTLQEGVLQNDTDAESALTAELLLGSGPRNGNINFRADGSFIYTPNAGFSGIDTFAYQAFDGLVRSSAATVTLSVGANSAPIANADSYRINRNSTLTATLSVLSNDSDPQGEPLTAATVTSVSNGSLQFNSNGTFVYTPSVGFSGFDSFTYRANDGSLTSDLATVTITVNSSSAPPTAVNNTYTVTANSPLTLAANQGVLANDTDPDNDPLTAVQGTGPANGTLTLNTNGSFTYTPNPNFVGTDSFTYQASDGINSPLATVILNVGGVNNPPEITTPGSVGGFRDFELVIPSGLSIADPDAGNNPVEVTLSATIGTLSLSDTTGLTFTAGDGTADGTMTFRGTIAAINTALTNLRYLPALGFTGSDVINITVNDQGNTGGTGTPQTITEPLSVNITSGVFLVRDINQLEQVNGTVTVTESSTPTSLVDGGAGTVYFAASDGFTGTELWRSDGSASGTVRVANINPNFNGSSSPSNLTVVGNTLYFTATDGSTGFELWRTDLRGITGTSRVRDIRSGAQSSSPTNLVNFNGTLFFRANDGSGAAIWRSDGTSTGTVRVGSGYTQPGNLIVVDNLLYFTANNGAQLWRTDGTDGGTVLVRDIGATAGIANLTAIGSTLFFSASDGNGTELWRSDGTPAGTVRTTDINPAAGSANPSSLVNLGGNLFFFASSGSTFGLWRSTPGGSASLVQALPSTGLAPTNLTVVGSNLLFVVDTGTPGSPNLQLWNSNGTTAALVRDLNPTGNDDIASLTNVSGVVYFTANDGGGTRIWRSDGTSTGTVPFSGIFTGPRPNNLTAVGNRLFFTADTGTSGVELWIA